MKNEFKVEMENQKQFEERLEIKKKGRIWKQTQELMEKEFII